MKLSEKFKKYHETDSISLKTKLKGEIEDTVLLFFDKLYREYDASCKTLSKFYELWSGPFYSTPYKKTFYYALITDGFLINVGDGDCKDYSYESFDLELEDRRICATNHYVSFEVAESFLDKIEEFDFERFKTLVSQVIKENVKKQLDYKRQESERLFEKHAKLLESL